MLGYRKKQTEEIMYDLNDLAAGPYLISDVGEQLQVVTEVNFAYS